MPTTLARVQHSLSAYKPGTCWRNTRGQSRGPHPRWAICSELMEDVVDKKLIHSPKFPASQSFKAHFIAGCQLLSANARQHLEIHVNSWINTICSLETGLGLSQEASLPAGLRPSPAYEIAQGRSTECKAHGPHLGVLGPPPSLCRLEGTWWLWGS